MADRANVQASKLTKAEALKYLSTFPTEEALDSFTLDELRKVVTKLRHAQLQEKNKSLPDVKETKQAGNSKQDLNVQDNTEDSSTIDRNVNIVTNADMNDKNFEFHQNKDCWEEYVERMELSFIANDITDEAKKAATLLTKCGTETYRLFRELCSPAKPRDKKFAELVKTMQEHLNPKKTRQWKDGNSSKPNRHRQRRSRTMSQDSRSWHYIVILQISMAHCKINLFAASQINIQG
ncbi:unnamed protein product [Lasius platythorax]|uniref:Uncharacterized protein n=1 Tax=Lasius platythorax TaxID=488582 RepID=A0AAV2MX15_9HYME